MLYLLMLLFFFCSCFGIHTYTAIHDRFIAHDLDVLRPQQLPSQTSCYFNAFLTLLMLFHLCFSHCNTSRILNMILACCCCCWTFYLSCSVVACNARSHFPTHVKLSWACRLKLAPVLEPW
jgi:hypothetical protein